MAQIPTPPSSREVSAEPVPERPRKVTTEDHVKSLDILLERYLYLLDQHQTLRADLAEQLSSGFFSLTHANYCSPPGRRYGEDFYDERMKATRTIVMTSVPSPGQADEKVLSCSESVKFDVQYSPVIHPVSKDNKDPPAEKSFERQQSSDDHDDEEENDIAPETDGSEAWIPKPPTPSESPQTDDETTEPSSRKPFRSDNPLSWYGILVPPSLKTAQQSFTQVIAGTVPKLASVGYEMRDLESRVRDLRTEMRLL